MRFTGTYQNSIDSKGRLVVPSKYRDMLGTRCVVTRGFDRCLYIYSMEDWEVFADKINVMKQTDKDVRKFIRQYFSNAEECPFDSAGRILIPQRLRGYAQIQKQLVIMGTNNKIEVWAAEVLEDPGEENIMDDEEFVKKIEIYDI